MKQEKNMKINMRMKNWKIKKASSFFLFYLLIKSVNSQPYYPLHPSVGDTIDRIEKLDYALFPKIENPELLHCFIDFENDQYFLLAFYQGKQEAQKIGLTQEEIVEAQQNIEKINAYYLRKRRSDSLQAIKDEYPNKPSGKAPVLMNGSLSEQAKKEARMYRRLQEDRRRMENHRRGIQPNEIRLEFK
jgi:hypothetical protein